MLDGEGDGFKSVERSNCVSALTVKRQRGHNRRYTCQFVESGAVKIQADYTLVFTGGVTNNQPGNSVSDCWLLGIS